MVFLYLVKLQALAYILQKFLEDFLYRTAPSTNRNGQRIKKTIGCDY